ncbi:MAG: nucleotidyltransferase family protein [Fibrobacter sp.]|nr:nucleotidyltransferase family protein [Fibrobacter sp.]
MFFSEDMKELLCLFEKNKVKYVIVGGFAVNFYGYVRMTQDIDLLVVPSKENAEKVMLSLAEFGFGEAGIQEEYFQKEGSAIHLGVEPNRIDLLTHLKGPSNDQIYSNSQVVKIDGIDVRMISLSDLLESKRKSDRLRDQADAEELEQLL